MYPERIEKLCAFLPQCDTFADIGCDHGYCTQYMLNRGLCKRAIIADISAKSLEKAEKLLESYIIEGKCEAVCCDGLTAITGADGVLIAGMGGEEICKILDMAYIPEKFVLQPMKNAPKVRKKLIESGCKITRDDLFCAGGKYYFVICGERQSESTQDYCEMQIEWGRDSLKNPELKGYLEAEAKKLEGYLEHNLSDRDRQAIESKLKLYRQTANEM